MLGLVEGLLSHRIDLVEADLFVGTSAGARTGAQVATGTLADAVALKSKRRRTFGRSSCKA
jgi:hypothetical protein